jgi:hypothetical protein
MKKLFVIAVVSGSLAGCASVQRAASYGDGQLTFDGKLAVEGREMSMSIHPRDSTLLVQRTLGDSAAAGALQGLTFGIARGWKPDPRKIDEALRLFLQPVGCTASASYEVGSTDTNYEARYACPAGVDLRAIMAAQRDALRRGEPLRR